MENKRDIIGALKWLSLSIIFSMFVTLPIMVLNECWKRGKNDIEFDWDNLDIYIISILMGGAINILWINEIIETLTA